MTRQNTQKPKYIVTIKKIKTPIKMELTTLLDRSLKSSLPFARDSYTSSNLVMVGQNLTSSSIRRSLSYRVKLNCSNVNKRI